METAVQKLMALNLLVLGVSHLAQPAAWAELFQTLHKMGRPGAFLNASLHFAVGTFVVAFHSVWHGIPVVLTVIGWGWTLKGALYFCKPELGLRSMERLTPEKAKVLRPLGAAMAAYGVLLGVHAW